MGAGGRWRVGRLVAVAVTVCVVDACAVNDTAYRDEGQAFVESAVRPIATEWNADELIARADPQFLEHLSEPKAREMVARLSSELGPLKRSTTQLATVGFNVGAWFGKGAQYTMKLECEKGTATLVVVARKVKERWRILGFWVNVEQQR